MLVVDSITLMREHLSAWRRNDETIALVPTMGNLHDGHLQLMASARERADRVVGSIYVNPLQFAPGSDFESYPRTQQQDLEKLKAQGVDMVFCPDDKTIYPEGMAVSTRVEVPGLSDVLCGEFRPGHFAGVTTVVAKLFNLLQPDVALFGEKDYQQLLIIKRMVKDLYFPLRVVGVATIREADGLALSSRNQYLSGDQRQVASGLYEVLRGFAVELGTRLSEPGFLPHEASKLEIDAMHRLREAGFKPDYVRVCDAQTLAPLATLGSAAGRQLRILAAAWLGKARLIDNVAVT